MEFRILGPLEVEDNGAVLPLGSRHPRILLAVLLLNANRVVSRDRLIHAIWGDQPPERATNALQVYVSQLRKSLGHDVIVTQQPGYLLRVEPGALDLARFEALRAEAAGLDPDGAAASFRAALALWRGPALADLDDIPVLEAERRRLEELRIGALVDRIDADLERGEHLRLVPDLESLVAEHPLRERLRGQLMLALYRSGRQAEALDVYRRGRRLLDDELGLEPGEALKRLERSILEQDAELAGPPSRAERGARVPTGTVTFLFTDVEGSTRLTEELGDAYGALLDGHNRLVRRYLLCTAPFYAVPAQDLALCMAYAHRKNRPLSHVYRHLNAIEEIEVSPEARAALGRLIEDLDAMTQLAARHPTGRVLYEYLVTRTGYVGGLAASGRPEDEQKVANLAKFFNLVSRYGEIAPVDRVPGFVQYLDLLIEAGDDPPAAEVETDADAVHVLTIHKAKGLEFPVVFMVGLVSDRFPSRGRGDPIPLPDALMKDILPTGDFHLQEERRLFYVGMTRARRDLYLTSAQDYGGARPRKVSRFVQEALDLPRADPETFRASVVQAVERHAPPVDLHPQLLLVPSGDEVVPLSFRQVDDYSTCPLKYKYIHILRVPVLRDHRVVYGAALHEAVQEYNRRRARHRPVTAEDLIAHFERSWVNEGFLSREHEDQRMEAGRDALRRFFEYQEASGTVPTFVEREFRFHVGATILRGRWDRVDVRGGEVVIIDFKSTDVRAQQDADRRAKDSEQLAIYTLAYREVFGRLPDRVELHFLGHQVLVGRARKTDAELIRTKEMILHAAQGIRAQQFIATPDPYRACPYCAFNQICPYTATAE